MIFVFNIHSVIFRRPKADTKPDIVIIINSGPTKITMLTTPISIYPRNGGEEAITISNKLASVFGFYKLDEDHMVDPPRPLNGVKCDQTLFVGRASNTPAGE